MRKVWFFFIFLSLAYTGFAQLPKYEFPEDPVAFGDTISQILNANKKESLMQVGDDFAQVWGGIGANVQSKIMEQANVMRKKGFKPYPHLVAYFRVINHAMNIDGTDGSKLNGYIETTGKVLENHNTRDFMKYLKISDGFFEHKALYYQRSNQLYTDGSYTFEYVAPPTVPEIDDEPVEDEPYDEEDDNWSEEEDDNWSDDWDEEEDDGWDTDYDEGSEDNWDEEEDISDVLVEENPLPEVTGAIIKFESTNLNINTPYDSVFLTKTKGSFMILDQVFVGEGGKFNWESAGLGADSVYCMLSTYSLDVRKPKIKAEKTFLTYTTRLYEPVEGVFEFRSVRHDSTTKVVNPRFMSYNSDIKVKGIGKPNLIYKGGFSLIGTEITSASVYGGLSKIEVLGEPTKKFVAEAKVFVLGDSIITSKQAKVTTYQSADSIYHPGLKFNFNTKTEDLMLLRSKGGFKGTPYTTSHFNMFFKADMIKWNLNSDSLDISVLSGRKVVPAYFESVDHFSPKDYNDLSGVYNFHPLRLVVNYGRKRGKEFNYIDLAEKYKLDPKTVRSAMVFLEEKGFVDFDSNSGQVILKRKARHYIASSAERKDFDNIIIESLIDSLPNATLNLRENTMKVRGVKKFDISKVLEVYITPDSSEITLLNDRDFVFNGRVNAGNFEYIGRDYKFKYDSFLIYMNSIDSVRFYVQEDDSRGKRARKRRVDNSLIGGTQSAKADTINTDGTSTALSGSSGVLYINKPDNKSGKEKYPNYPRFNAGTGATVFFDRSEMLGGVYDKSISFEVPPFDIDSISNSDPASIGFDGTFKTDGIVPEFEESLHVMDDYSLGFDHKIPDEGYKLYEGEAQLYGDLKLDKSGLRSKGKIDFLTTTLESEDFLFYPDSVVGAGQVAEIRGEEYNGVIFPQATLTNYDLKWMALRDSMYISNTKDPFTLYNETAELDGTAIVSSHGLYGKGKFSTRGSHAESEQITFRHDAIKARHASFEVETNDPEKPALAGKDVYVNFNLTDNYADISPEVEGEAALEFPYAKFKTSINTARWDLESNTITMTKPDDVPIENSYFYTTRKELDSLRFNATEAVYDIETQDLKVSGIPYIIVADAKITPENNEVLIHENSRIGILHNTVIVLDTLNAHHRLYDGEINIFSRNAFAGIATYQYVNSEYDTFAIRMENFRLEPLENMKQTGVSFIKRKKAVDDGKKFQTVADGSVLEEDNVMVSPRMYFKGDMTLYASKPALQLEGYVKLELKKIPDYNTWIKYSSSAEQQQVVFDFDKSVTEEGRKLEAGLLFAEDNSLYSTFVTDKKGAEDEKFFDPSGYLYFDEKSGEFIIEEPEKANNESLKGKVFAYNENTSDIRFEGPVNFMSKARGVSIDAAALGQGNLETNEYSMNSFLVFDFKVTDAAYEAMATDIKTMVDEIGVSEGLGDQTELLYKLAELIGDKGIKEYEKQSKIDYVPIAGFSKEVTKSLVFADVNLKWSQENKAFYNEGKLGMSNINRNDINGSFEGFLEIKKTVDGGTDIHLFFKVSPETWYFFSYENNRLLLHSSNNIFNGIVADKSNAKKAKLGELVFFPGDDTETLSFINRFRKEYYDIDEEYDLQSADESDEFEDEDGFGGVSEEGAVTDEEEDDDDGF